MSPIEDCCYSCPGHDGPPVCGDNETERSATERLCDDCFETTTPVETEAEIDAAYEAWLRLGFPA